MRSFLSLWVMGLKPPANNSGPGVSSDSMHGNQATFLPPVSFQLHPINYLTNASQLLGNEGCKQKGKKALAKDNALFKSPQVYLKTWA